MALDNRSLLQQANSTTRRPATQPMKETESIISDIASAAPIHVEITPPYKPRKIKKTFDLIESNAIKLAEAARKYGCREGEIINQLLEKVEL